MASRNTMIVRVPRAVISELRMKYPNSTDGQRINFAFLQLKQYENSINAAGSFLYGRAWKK